MKPTKVKTAVKIGDVSNDEEILVQWKDHFGNVVNSQEQESFDCDKLDYENLMKTKLGLSRLPWWCVEIRPSEVEKAFGQLKCSKSTGPDDIQAEHLKYGGFELAVYFSIAFTAFLRHSFVPSQFLKSYVIPIVKDKLGDVTDKNNYRGIDLFSIASKAFEIVLLDRLSNVMSVSDQQFGFKT